MAKPKMKERHWQKAGIVAVIASIIVFAGWLALGPASWATIMSSAFLSTLVVLFVLLALVDVLVKKGRGKWMQKIEWWQDLVGAFLAAIATYSVLALLGVSVSLGFVGWIVTVIVMFVLIYIGEYVGCWIAEYI